MVSHHRVKSRQSLWYARSVAGARDRVTARATLASRSAKRSA